MFVSSCVMGSPVEFNYGGRFCFYVSDVHSQVRCRSEEQHLLEYVLPKHRDPCLGIRVLGATSYDIHCIIKAVQDYVCIIKAVQFYLRPEHCTNCSVSFPATGSLYVFTAG